MLEIFKSIFAIIAGYLLGSIPFGLIMGKMGYGIDIREFGSGNVGATNVFRVLGTLPGVLVLVGDFLKGALSLLLTSYLFPNAPTLLGSHEQVVLTDAIVVVLAGMAAILGHSWSIYLKFSGGKGVATGAGVLTVLAPNVTGILFLIWLLIVMATRYVSLASITTAFILPLLMLYFQAGNYPYILFSILATIVIVYKHKANIKRLLAGEELKFGISFPGKERKVMERIAVIGAGSWGTAISTLLAKKGFSVTLWARDSDLAEAMQNLRRNPRYLPELLLPKNLYITGDLSKALSKVEIVTLAVPSHAMRSIIRMLKDELKSNILIVSLTKGIEVDTLMRMSEIIQGELSSTFQVNIGVLSGPNHAEEVAQEIPTATVVSAFDKGLALKLQEVFMTPYFRVYTNPDVVGVELGGATKNVIAIAVGISDGLGYGDNTKASLMTRGLAEMTRLGVTLGARSLTFAGLSGVGDLIATCTSRHSRNRAVGEKLGRGMSLSQILRETTMVAEGIRTAKAVYQLAQKYGVDMPITKSVVEVIYFGKDPHDCVVELMSRGPTEEIKERGI